MLRIVIALVTAMLSLGLDISAAQTRRIIYVDDDAPPGGDGTSWATAFKYLQDSLAVGIAGDEIRVAGGTYVPDPTGLADPREATFQLINGVAIQGGYAGYGATEPDQRNIATYETILSGDLNGDDGPDWEGNDENAYHVVITTGTDETSLLDGVTITAGNANGVHDDYQDRGGGIYNADGSPALANCIVMGNSAESDYYYAYGGGVYNGGGDLTLTDCTIAHNSVYNGAWRAYGGGMYSRGGGPTLTRCHFTRNAAYTFDGYAYGGGMASSQGNAALDNCTFVGNSASDDDGRSFGGGMYNYEGDLKLANCAFTENSARTRNGRAFGGGLYNSGASPMVVGCRFSGNAASGSSRTYGGAIYNYYGSRPTLINCSFTGNSAVRGGAVSNTYNSTPTLTNCTFVGNSATDGGGLHNYDSIAVLANCILWANGSSSESAQLDADNGRTFVNHSCIQGLTGLLGGIGNIADDPLFVDADGPDDIFGTLDDDVHLLSGSPCIDAGNSSADVAALVPGLQPILFTDLQGSPRFVDMITVPDTGAGTFPIVDMGVFEHVDDCNGNGRPDADDIAKGDSEDCNSNGVPEECEGDCNENGVPDACEPECNGNGIPDDCDVAAGTSPDCNGNNVPDSCDIVEGTSDDCTGNGLPDECEIDCNDNGVADSCDLTDITSQDCNQDGIPDECLTYKTDCNDNGLVDECETAEGITPDVNRNGLPDECEPSVLFVDGNAAGLNNGKTWADAFNHLQDALSVAADSSGFVEEIWVAAGTYRPADSGGAQVATFRLASGVCVYGGFAGTESDTGQRDPDANETILSGDLNGDDDPNPISNCCTAHEPGGCDDIACQITVCAEISDCCTRGWDETCALRAVCSCCETCGNVCDNTYHVVTGSDTDETTLLDGFVIRGGYAGGEEGDEDRGGGMVIVSGSPVISNCTFADNTTRYGGGGLYAGYEASPSLVQCAFSANVALSFGGGMFNHYSSSPILADCTFIGNSGGTGGGMTNYGGSPVLSDCTFRRNRAVGGGGMSNISRHGTTLTGCNFAENRADFGGGVYNMCWATPTLNNCIFIGNSARYSGGGMYNDFATPGGPVANSTFTENSAGVSGGAVFNGWSRDLTLVNSIFWDNDDSGGIDQSAQIHIDQSEVDIRYCCIQGWTGQLGGIGNFGLDPLFVPGPAGWYYLSQTAAGQTSDSPCVDAGSDTAVNLGLDMLTTRADEMTDTGIVDVGYHYPVTDMLLNMGDFDRDGHVTLRDFAEFQKCFTGTGTGPTNMSPPCRIFDFKLDGEVNLGDYIAFEMVFNP